MNKKKVVIVVYSLATKNGVGARRWQKFALELANLNFQVFIIGSKNDNNEYLNHHNITYHTFNSSYPEVLDTVPLSVFQKIRYHLAVKKQKSKVKGATYDRSALDQKVIVSIISKLIELENVTNLIVSGAPFSLLHFGTFLKTKYPFINLISDIRDAWTWGEGYGINKLPELKKAYEEKQEKDVVNISDVVTVASEDLKLHLVNKYHGFNKSKFVTLLNGIEFEEVRNWKSFENDIITIIHIGSVNLGLEKYWKPFLNIINDLKNEVNLKFVGGNNASVLNYVLENNISNVEFVSRVPENELADLVDQSHFVLMFKKDGFENTFPSKYFDYIKYEKPIIAFVKEGSVYKEIVENQLGAIFNENVCESELSEFINLNKNKPFNKAYDKSKFSIKNITKEIVSILD